MSSSIPGLLPPTAGPGWTLLVPVKDTARGKSRLDVPDELRPALALAIAMDTISAAASCGRVLAVVESDHDGLVLGRIGNVAAHRSAVAGLNESIMDGLAALARRTRAPFGPVAVLPGDLPGLDRQELAAVLRRCAEYDFAVVPDHLGVGTTLLTASRIEYLHPHYGADSFRRHQLAGAVPIDLAQDSSVRMDTDTLADLQVAAGWRTAAVLGGIAAGRRAL